MDLSPHPLPATPPADGAALSVLLVAAAVPCPWCEAVAAARGEGHPLHVAELEGGLLLLHPDQRHTGHVVYVAKAHVADAMGLSAPERAVHMRDLQVVMEAVHAAVAPLKLNVAAGLDGHADGHLHWHVVPRHPDDGAPGQAFWPPEAPPAWPQDAARAALKRQLLRGLLAARPLRREPARRVR